MCDKTDHVMTTGPKYSQIIKYFACEEFVKMSPADRFNILRKNDYAFSVYFQVLIGILGIIKRESAKEIL